MRARDVFAALLLAAASIRLSGQVVSADSARPPAHAVSHLLHTVGGSTYLGHLVANAAGPDSIRFETDGGVLTLPKTAVREIVSVSPSDMHDGQYWFPNPNATRLFFAPTGRMLSRGEGYYSNTYLFFNGVSRGITDNFSIGGSATLLPSSARQVGYLTPKLGVYMSDNVNVGVGALLGYNGFGSSDAERQFGILYSVATVGSPDLSGTAGIGWGYQGSKLANQPAVMIGGVARVSRRMALVTENYYVSAASETHTILGYGFRFFGEKLSVDLAFLNSASDPVFPGIPFISFAVKF
jgi:hypothetical protein